MARLNAKDVYPSILNEDGVTMSFTHLCSTDVGIGSITFAYHLP